MDDLLIRGARLYDGTGPEPVQADLAVRDGRIRDIGVSLPVGATRVIDAAGLALMPGALLKDPVLRPRMVPSVADGARTFGMANLSKQVGIHSSVGQRHEPEDIGSVLSCEVLAAAALLRDDWGIDAEVWSAASYSELEREARGSALEPAAPAAARSGVPSAGLSGRADSATTCAPGRCRSHRTCKRA